MIRLVVVKNPFQPRESRVVKNYMFGITLRRLVDEAGLYGAEINCTMNGNVIEVDNDYVVPDNNIVVVSPVVSKGGKSILGIIAMVAMAAVSVGAGLLVSQGLSIAGSTIIGAGTFGAYLAAASVMFLGSMLVGKITPNNTPKLNASQEQDATYSWGGVQTTEGQNNPIVMTYGKVKSGGQTIGKFVETKDDKEYLNWLISAGEGEIEFSNILINDNDINNYGDVNVETRAGTNNQSIISNFNDTYFTKNLGYQLVDNEVVDIAQGNAIQGLKVKFEFSNGLYYAQNDGKLGEASATINAWYRRKGDSTWILFVNDIVKDKKSSAVRREYRIDNIPVGEYEVKAKVNGRSHDVTNSRASTRCWWTGLTSIVYDDFEYPNIALIGIKALATDQINGNPTISFVKERKYVWVYNTHTKAYEQKNANNPAWASYDMLHLASRLYNVNTNDYEFECRGVPARSLIYEQFDEWAEFCDSKNLHVNIEITQASEMLECINTNIANCGRGNVIRFGTRYGCVWDCVKQPVQMFGMSNIKAGTFKEDFLPLNDRANCVEITYNDENQNYNRNVITIYGDNYDESEEEKTAQVTYNGITSYEQAYKEGMYQLYCNKYLLRTVSFDVDIDAIACTVGDCVLVAHDVPKWAYSGRILEVDVQNNKLKLPIYVEDITKQYEISYRTLNDSICTSNVTILEHTDNYCVVQTSTPFNKNDIPQENDIFNLGVKNIGSKPFIIKSISRSQDFTRKIECLEYNEAIYNEQYDIPPINYTEEDYRVENVYNLVATQIKYIDEYGNYEYKLEASWEYDKNANFIVYASYDNENYTLLSSYVTDRDYSYISKNKILKLKVVTKSGISLSKGNTVSVGVIDDIILPSVNNARAHTKYRELLDDVTRYDIVVEWDISNFEGYKQAQVWFKTSGTQCDNLGVIPQGTLGTQLGYQNKWQYAGQGYDMVIIPQAIVGDTYKIAICTIDAYGNAQTQDEALKFDYLVEAKTETPNTPNNISCSITDTFNVYWDEVRNADIKYYEVRTNTNIGTENGLLVRTTENSCNIDSIKNREGTIYVYSVSAYGKCSAPAIIEYQYAKPSAPKLSVEGKIQGIQCVASDLPVNCNAIHWYFEAGSNIVDVINQNATYYHSCEAGVYEVYACYVDYFGDGTLCGSQMVTIEAYISSALIQDGTIAEAKLENSLKNTLNGYGESIAKLKTDIGALDGLSDLETKIQSIDKIVKELENQDFSSYLLKSETNDYINTNLVSWNLIDGNKKQVNVYTKNETSNAIETALTSYTKTTDLGKALKIDEYYKKTETQNYVATELGKYYTKTAIDNKGYATTSAVNETLKQYVTSSGLATEISKATTNAQNYAKDYADGVGEAVKEEAEEKLGIATQGIEQKFGSYWTADEVRQELNSYTLYTDLTKALDNYSTLDQTTTSINNIVGSYTRGDGWQIPRQELKKTRSGFVLGGEIVLTNNGNWWLAQYDVKAGEIYYVVVQLYNQNNTGVVFTDENNRFVAGNIPSSNKTNSNTNTTLYDIGEDYVTVPQGATKMWVNARANKNNGEQACSACIKVRKAGGTYSAITQLDNAIGLKVSTTDFNGNNIVNKINMTSTTTTIDGKLLHITGDTLFDNNVVVKGTWSGNAITADKLSVTSLSAITGTIGTLQTATTGARTVIKDNLIEVYDSSNKLRVRLGVW